MKSRRLVTEHSQAFSFTRRALVLSGAQLGVAGLLTGRMGWLAIAENERYRVLAESNRVQMQLIPPRRGWIVDRVGKPIAINRASFRIDIIPNQLQDRAHVVATLQQLLSLSPDDVAQLNDDLDAAAPFQPVQVASNVDYEKFAAVSVRLPELAGVQPGNGSARYYPAGPAVAHLVGYVGAASAADYEKTRDPLLVTPGFKVGKEGLERTMEPWLRGSPGAKRAEVTAHGKVVRELTTRPEKVGHTLQLTIDAGLQEFVARRLGPNSGSVVAIDTQTGGILALASMPAYDPNSFSDGISKDDWAMLSSADHLPLMNKVLQGLYPPGSTVKTIMSLALLNAGITPQMSVTCTGSYRVGDTVFHCDKRNGHGPISMERAIAQSCDIYFYHFGRMVGMDAIAPVARELGLGQKFQLPFSMQRFGTVPDPAWLQRKYHRKWMIADTINSSIGQGYLLVNPLQLAVVAARIASGKKLEPRLIVNRNYGPQGGDLDVTPEHLDFVRGAMGKVVTEGTAARSQLPLQGIRMAGKTGTAQVRRITMAERSVGVRSNESLPWRYRDHALFIGFAPVENPRYAVAVIIEHGGWGASAAAPIARDALTYMFDPIKASVILADLEKGWGGGITERMKAESDRWAAAKAAEAAAASQPDNAAAAVTADKAKADATTDPNQPSAAPAQE